jgi:Cd2+/Zn2+-exporting ATPase
MDKTGTLTKGEFRVQEVNSKYVLNNKDIDTNIEIGTAKDKNAEFNKQKCNLLYIAAHAEMYSNHPIAKSIIEEYNGKLDASRVEDVTEISGQGLLAKVDGKLVYIGNEKLMIANNIDFQTCEKVGTVVYIAIENEYKGYILISDTVKETTPLSIKAMRKSGIRKLAMLTGDNKVVAESVAKELALDEVYGELLPADKVQTVEKLIKEKKENEKLAFIGDGINDAPVLMRADVGIAMGALGSDVAIEAADIVIMDDDLSKVPKVIDISKKTLTIVKQNIVFALGVKMVVLILSMFHVVGMWGGVFADVGVAVLAILNSMRMLWYKNKDN